MTADAEDTPPHGENEDDLGSLFERGGGATATAEVDGPGGSRASGTAEGSTATRPVTGGEPGGDGQGPGPADTVTAAAAPTAPAAKPNRKKPNRKKPNRKKKVRGPGPTPGPETAETTVVAEPERRRLGRKARRKLRARKVERILRRVDPWSVMKLSFLFLLCLWVIFMMAGVILWTAAVRTGAIDNVENFITELFALESFAFEGEQLFRGSAVGGLILVLVGTGFNVLLAVLFNLISDLTGGIRLSAVELENLRQRESRSRDEAE